MRKLSLKSLEKEKLNNEELKNINGGAKIAVEIYKNENATLGFVVCTAYCKNQNNDSVYNIQRNEQLNNSKYRKGY
jgi:bacteriocin-like protein